MNQPKRVVILGTCGNSLDILDSLNDFNDRGWTQPYECLGFLDDDESLWGKVIHGVKVLGPLELAQDLRHCAFVNGIGGSGDFWKRDAIIAKTGVSSDRFETFVHPSATVSRLASLGRGVVILQHAVIASNVVIGDHVVVASHSITCHDATIGSFTFIAGGVCVSERVKVGRSCFLGANSTMIDCIEIGDRCLVGMGSVVLSSVPSNTVVVGNPARFLRHTVNEERCSVLE